MIIYEAKQSYRQVGIIENGPLNSPKRVVEYMSGAFEVAPLQEQVWVIMLNTKNLPIAREQCSVGTSSACMLNPTVVFRPAILANATAIIICHNHPSGNPTPSTADLNVTKDIVRAGKTLNISVHDHVIIADGGHYSFQERGLI